MCRGVIGDHHSSKLDHLVISQGAAVRMHIYDIYMTLCAFCNDLGKNLL